MTRALPIRPDLEHLRREAKRLLAGWRAGDSAALARRVASAPELAHTLNAAQLVVARGHGFASWAQLKAAVTGLAGGGVRYDAIGAAYADHRRADPSIAAVIDDALVGMRTVVNVGAGTGSYEPTDRPVVAVEPSSVMAAQRDPAMVPAVLGVAESLPLVDGSVDAALALMTMQHWADVDRGLAELRRVARRRVLLLTIDVRVEAGMWLFDDYAPEFLVNDRREFPAIERLVSILGSRTRVVPVPVPANCADGMGLAFWDRPERVLEAGARAATSGFARMDDRRETEIVNRLAGDLADGSWDRAYGQLRTLPDLDVGLRLVVADAPW